MHSKAERVDERLRPSGPENRCGWSSPKPRYSRTRPAPCGKARKWTSPSVPIACSRPVEVVGAVDEHAGEVVVRRVLLRARSRATGGRSSCVRRRRRASRAVASCAPVGIAPRDRRLRLERRRRCPSTPRRVSAPSAVAGVEQRLAGVGVALRHRAVDPRAASASSVGVASDLVGIAASGRTRRGGG